MFARIKVALQDFTPKTPQPTHLNPPVLLREDSGAAEMIAPSTSPIVRPGCLPHASPVSRGKKLDPLAEFVAYLSPEVKEYIARRQAEIEKGNSVTAKIAALKLDEKEKEIFKRFQDPITLEYMDIPINLKNENYFSHMHMATMNFKHPFKEDMIFSPDDVLSGQTLLQDLESMIHDFKQTRASKQPLNEVGPAASASSFNR